MVEQTILYHKYVTSSTNNTTLRLFTENNQKVCLKKSSLSYNDIIREENAFIEIRSLLLEKKMILDLRFYNHCVLFNGLLYYLATFLTRCRFTFPISNLFSLYNTNMTKSTL